VALASDIIALARPLTDHDSDAQVTDPQLVALLSPRYLALRRKLGRAVPSLYRSTVTWTAAAVTQDVTAAPLSLTDYDRVHRLRWQTGTGVAGYAPLGVANPLNPEAMSGGYDFAFLERGTILEFYPSAQVVGTGFELSYITKGAALTAVGSTVVLPDGADYILAQLLAADIRIRFDESPKSHLDIANDEWKELRWALQQRYGVHSEGLVEEG
jgi:hypothetical protein